jgi:hypothetical protein
MDGNEQVGFQMISARRMLEQTGHPGPARDQSDCFVEPCLMQRLRDHVGDLEVEFVFWRATGAVRAMRVAVCGLPLPRSKATLRPRGGVTRRVTGVTVLLLGRRPIACVSHASRIDVEIIHPPRCPHQVDLVSSGLSLEIVGRLLGHTNPTTTKRYSHIADSPLRAATERFGAKVDSLHKRLEAEIVPIKLQR